MHERRMAKNGRKFLCLKRLIDEVTARIRCPAIPRAGLRWSQVSPDFINRPVRVDTACRLDGCWAARVDTWVPLRRPPRGPRRTWLVALRYNRGGGAVMGLIERRSDRYLLTLCIVLFAVYTAIFASAFADLPLNIPPWHQALLLFSHFVPMFFLELFLCRTVKLGWRVIVPLVPLMLVGFWFLSSAEWHAMAWVLFSLWCVPPLLGCLVAWAVWAICGRRAAPGTKRLNEL